MTPGDKLFQPLAGIAQLCRFNRQGLNLFHVSPGGFWLSWLALPLALGPYLMGIDALSALAAASGRRTIGLPVMATMFTSSWLLYAALFLGLTQWLRISRTSIPTLMVLNWFRLFELGFVAPLLLLGGHQLIPNDVFSLLYLVIVSYFLGVQAFVFRIALQATTLQATALVAVDVVLDMVLSRGFQFFIN